MVAIEQKLIYSKALANLFLTAMISNIIMADAFRIEIENALKLTLILQQPLSFIFNLLPYLFDLQLICIVFDF